MAVLPTPARPFRICLLQKADWPFRRVTLASACAVPALAENSEQPLHARCQVRLRRFEQEVEMVAHEHPGMHPPAATPARLLQPFKKNQAVIIRLKDRLPAIATGHDMIHCSRILESQKPRHASFSSNSDPASFVMMSGLTPKIFLLIASSSTAADRVGNLKNFTICLGNRVAPNRHCKLETRSFSGK